jgi:host factor-I protein
VDSKDAQAEFLDKFITQRTPVWVFLINGIKLTGHIAAFDRYVITVESSFGTQLVLKSAVSTVIEQHAILPRPAEARDKSQVGHRSPHRIR